jgi:hypothetical protein
MSWDVMIMMAEGTPLSLQELPRDWLPKPMGDAAQVRAAISNSLDGVDWSQPAWGTFAGDLFTFEINIIATGSVDAFSLHARGAGDPLPAIVELCSANGWCAFDYSTGERIDLENPSRESWLAFQDYRARVTSRR